MQTYKKEKKHKQCRIIGGTNECADSQGGAFHQELYPDTFEIYMSVVILHPKMCKYNFKYKYKYSQGGAFHRKLYSDTFEGYCCQ